MIQELSLLLNPPVVTTTPGRPAEQVRLSIQNGSAEKLDFSVEVLGLDPGWVRITDPKLSLFRQTSKDIGITFQPPRQPGLHKGSYPYNVVVRARRADGSTLDESITGTLELSGHFDYDCELVPRQVTARREGHFRVRLRNTGSRDIELTVSAQDNDRACEYRFEGGATRLVAEGQALEVPLTVRPLDARALLAYDFTVSSARADEPRLLKTLSGRFTPTRFTFPWWLLRNVLLALAAVTAVLALLSLLPMTENTPLRSVRETVCRLVPIPGACVPESPHAACVFGLGFEDSVKATPELIGACITNEIPDSKGNTRQYTAHGVLFWHKATNTVYFFKDNAFYAYLDDNGAQELLGP